jgi:hemoglobin-like flavoprotein
VLRIGHWYFDPASDKEVVELSARMAGNRPTAPTLTPRATVASPFCHDIFTVTSEQVHLIRNSFDSLWPVRRQLAEIFYNRLFELTPDARRLFPADMERQQLKLMDMIAALVGALDKHEIFQSLITHTGRQHAQFGVKPSHFVAFGDALIGGLERQFGTAFTPETRQAWLMLYDTVQTEMIRAARLQ